MTTALTEDLRENQLWLAKLPL